MKRYGSIVNIAMERAQATPNTLLYGYCSEGETISDELSFSQLDQRARTLAVVLQECSKKGERVLLAYSQNLEFVCSFFACLYAEMIAVPVYPPDGTRTWPRFLKIARDCNATLICTNSQYYPGFLRQKELESGIEKIKVLDTTSVKTSQDVNFNSSNIAKDTLSFIQYTSGTTGSPKGVMVSNRNIVENLTLISERLNIQSGSRIVSWLPFYHDMGLIGNIILPLFIGASNYLMPPDAFVRRPSRWLRLISKYEAAISGGPNFAYDLCCQRVTEEELTTLDLAPWTCAYTGAEKVQANTLRTFSDKFSTVGFKSTSFLPCYGMAEATLMIASGAFGEQVKTLSLDADSLKANQIMTPLDKAKVEEIVCCGVSNRHEIAIFHPDTRKQLDVGHVGEIWVSGSSVSNGYWNKPEINKERFNVTGVEYLSPATNSRYFRTGDVGFLWEGCLYVTGRMKELIIIRGRNYYPQDIETVVQDCHEGLRKNAGVAFSADIDGTERLVLVQEVSRSYAKAIDVEDLTATIRLTLAQEQSIELHDLVLIKQSSCPMTSSGKIQRVLVKQQYINNNLQTV